MEVLIRQEAIVRTVLRALEELTRHHDVMLRLSVRRDDTTAFNPWHEIQRLGLAHKVVYLPFFDNCDLPDVVGDACVWLEAPEAPSPSANCCLAMQTGVVVAGPPELAVPSDCFWPVGNLDRADELARRLATLLSSQERMAVLRARAREFVEDHLGFSCEPVKYVSPHQERTVHGWYTNQHFVLFVTSSQPDGPGAATKKWLEDIRSLGYRIVCIHDGISSEDLFRDQVDHYFNVPATSPVAGINQEYGLHVDDLCGSTLTLKVQEICNTYSVGVCFVDGVHLSRVLDRIPGRIRRVLAIDNGSPAAESERIARARADVVLTAAVDQRRLQEALAPSYTVPDTAQHHFLNYHDVTMRYLTRFVGSCAGQVMLEVGPDDHLALARTVLANGAERVIGIQTTKRTYDDLPERLQFTMVNPTRWEGIADESVDVVYGVGVLEHITHFEEVVDEIARVLKPGGRVFVQGCPMWGSSHGHHVVVFDSADGRMKYNFMQPDRNPLDSWEHVALAPEQMRDDLLEKRVPQQDADAIVAMVFGRGIGSNGKMPGDIIAAFRRRLQTDAVRYLDTGERNQYFRAAAQRYPEKELLTDALLIYAHKPVRTPARPRGQRPLVRVTVRLSTVAPIVRPVLESIATQTYTDLDVLLLADVPPGPCLAVAEEYVGVDARFHLLDPSAAPSQDVLLYDADTTLDCRTIEALVLSRYLPISPVNLSGLSDLGPASIETHAVEELG